MNGLESAKLKIEGVLKRILGLDTVPVDNFGNWGLSYGSTNFYIRVLPMYASDKHIVQVFSPMISEIPYSPQLMNAVNALNVQIMFGRVAWVNNVLFAFSELVAETVDELELRVACNTIATIADTYDNALQMQFGGKLSILPSEQKPVKPAPVQTSEQAPASPEGEQQLSLAGYMQRDQIRHQFLMNLLQSQASNWQQLKF